MPRIEAQLRGSGWPMSHHGGRGAHHEIGAELRGREGCEWDADMPRIEAQLQGSD